MANQNELTAKQLAHIAGWIQSRAKHSNCPVCDTNNWSLAPHVVSQHVIKQDGSVQLGGTQYPQVLMYCQNCSFVRPFFAIPMEVPGFMQDEKNLGAAEASK